MAIITVTINNWTEYNGRADVKHATWFRMSNQLLEEPELYGRSSSVILVWLYVLSAASKKGTPSPRLMTGHVAALCRIKESEAAKAIDELLEIGWLKKEADEQAIESMEAELTKAKARGAVKTALRNGALKKPSECEVCGKHSYRIEGHHADYSKPLDVQWLCTACHRTIHAAACVRTRTQTSATDRQTDTTDITDKQDRTGISGDPPAPRDVPVPIFHPLLELWNENCGTLPKVKKNTPERNREAQKLWASHSGEEIVEAIKNLARSDFCNGKNDRGWVATPDWFLNPKNFLKAFENKFENRGAHTISHAQRRENNLDALREKWEVEN